MDIKRVPTGIKGFDALVEGGIPEGDSILVSGPVGSHNLLFGLEFLYRGAERGETVMFASFERDGECLMELTSMFDWRLDELIKQKKFIVYKTELFNVEKFLAGIEEELFSNKATRLVVDSTSFIGQFLKDEFRLRNALTELKKQAGKQNCTTMLICETRGNEISEFGVEENVADGIVQTMLVEEKNNLIHALAIRNMRSTEFNMQMRPFDVKKSGLCVYNMPIVD